MKRITGKDIVNYLEKKFSLKLPAYGALAGQAVASAYFELKNSNFEPVYNDIDVFIYDAYFKKFKEYDNLNIEFFKNNMDISLVKDYPETMELPRLRFDFKKPYRILDTSREGLLNRIIVSENVSLKKIIDGFDLNCVQIGVDLFTGKLYKTKAFDEYFKTGVLKVISYASPHHTAIRLLNKEHISGKSDNIEKEMMEIATFIDLDNRWIKEKNDFESIGYFPFFGIKRFKDYEKNPKIKKYFDVYAHNDFEMFQLLPDFDTKYKTIEKNMNNFLSRDNNIFSRVSFSQKEKLYLVHEYKDYFMKEKDFDKTITIGELKYNTLTKIFGKLRFQEFSEKTRKILHDEILLVSTLGKNDSLILKRMSEAEIVQKLKDVNKVFPIQKQKKEKRRLEIQKGDDVYSLSKINFLTDFVERGGDFLKLQPEFKDNIYNLKIDRIYGMPYPSMVFSLYKNNIVILNKNDKKDISKGKMRVVEEIVKSTLYKSFFS